MHQISPYISTCASFILLSPLAFSGLALFPLTTLYLYLAFSFYWRNHQQKYRNAAPEAC
ncbi:hypothetical protein CDE93_001892 [Salmonella enterica subsp. enterica serovar Abony]|nr:hypothetical protein [Salmonella enterica subsp. enterica serovar Abony]EDT0454396.1 hypothetical protein [Salmonella enterica]EDS0124195.1 hypothetical protein [Salmonella enterica subsp. enterica serovar Abony]EDU3860202.1 hypothetical protein [Salmonella enterica subsp. enterica serovar Abony]EDU4253716.1 hypothetical protein [Salmonella enterica subsp. enterica serovar Abony]